MQGEIVPFQSDMLDDAGQLLAERHALDRARLSHLPQRFEESAVAQAAVAALWERPHTNGVAVVEQGRLLGFMMGTLVIDAVWGRSAWIYPAGLALAAGPSVECLQDLYAALGAQWVDAGCFTHVVWLPTADPAQLQAWYALSFGIEQVHALLPLVDYDPGAAQHPDDLEIRRAGPADRAILADLSDVIWKHQLQAPVWGVHLPENVAAGRQNWADLANDDSYTTWLAFYQGAAVGIQIYYPPETSAENLLIPNQCIRLTVGGTRVAVRRRGIGRALTQHGLKYAQAQGFKICEADWRSTNLPAARFWSRQGFRPVAYRLVRRVDPRIAWARSDTRFA